MKKHQTSWNTHTYTHTHTHTHTLTHRHIKWNDTQAVKKKKKNLPSVTTRVDPEGIMWRKISQRNTSIIWFHLCVESEKQNRWKHITKLKQSNRCREQMGDCQRERGRGRKEINERDSEIETWEKCQWRKDTLTMAAPTAQLVRNPLEMQETPARSLGGEDPLEMG